MKTVFITLSLGVLGERYLKTPFFNELKNRQDIKTVFFVDEEVLGFMRKNFSSESIIFEGIKRARLGTAKKAFLFITQSLVWNDTVSIFSRMPPDGRRRYFKPFLRWFVANTIGRFWFLKNAFEPLDYFFFKSRPFKEIFDRHGPSFVLITNPTNDELDTEVLKEAKRRGVKMAMSSKSWDAFNQRYLHLKADELWVWGKTDRKDAINIQGYSPKNVHELSTPHIDLFKNEEKLLSKEKFFRQKSIPQGKKLVMFGSILPYIPHEPKIFETILKLKDAGKINKDAIFLVRPYNKFEKPEDDYHKFRRDDVLVDELPEGPEGSPLKWAMFFRDPFDLPQEMKHADLLITFASTLTFDASFFDTPVILVNFDVPKQPEHKSLKRYYKSSHYKHIINTGAGRLVDSPDELAEAINDYLANPEKGSEKRARLVTEIAGPWREDISKRMVEKILNSV